MSDESQGPVRELFIEELAEVQGGNNKIVEMIRDALLTTYGQCEEIPIC